MSENVLVELSDALADAAQSVGKATIMVNGRRGMAASGFGYTKDLILTADHVLERNEGITATLADSTELPARIVGRDAASDIALLNLEGAGVEVAQPARTPARLGQIVLIVGRPSRNGLEASLGTISAIGGPVPNRRGGILEEYIRTDGISYPGFSGGPLAAADGTVLGLNTSGKGKGAALTIPAGLTWEIATSLAQHGRVRRGYLGIRSQEAQVSKAAQNLLKRDQATGLLVVGLEPDSPAWKGGFLVGDILVAIAGVPVPVQDELFTRLRGDLVGQSTPVEIVRGGLPHTLNVVVGEK